MSTPFPAGDLPSLLADRYEVEVEIGSGAFATTYRGRDRRLDRLVAIKVLSPEFARDPAYVQRFEREAQTAAAISNGNVVDVYDFGQQDDVLYIVMQYIAGEDLKHLIAREGAIGPERAREIALEILSGLTAIHQAGIVHRDIKPQNILIGTDGRARVADFGIAQVEVDHGLTTTGTAIGTAAYMAPEQAQGGRTTPETDLYAVGVVLYEMLTGSLPFSAPTSMAMMLAHVQQQPAPPSTRSNGRPIPLEIDGVVMQAMAKDPRDRFRSAPAMAQALRGASMYDATAAIRVTTARSTTRRTATPPPAGGTRAGGSPPPVTPTYQRMMAEEGRGGGPGGALAGTLLLVLIGLVSFGGYLWWNDRHNGSVVDSPTATVVATDASQLVDAPTELPPTPAPTESDQVILPEATDPPAPTATMAPTSPPPTETQVPPTDVPPTAVPPTATLGVIAPQVTPTPAGGDQGTSESPPIQPIGTQAGG